MQSQKRSCKALLKVSIYSFFFIYIIIFGKTKRTLNMKNWVVKLILLLLVPSILGVLVTVVLGANPEGWLRIVTYILSPLLTLIGGAYMVGGKWKVLFLVLMAMLSVAFNVPLQNWFFHSADDVVHYDSVTDLYNPENKALYFIFDSLEVDYARKSSVVITREVTRNTGRHRFRTEKKQYYYAVVPVFEDSLSKHKYVDREVKAWVVPVKHSKNQPVICYERCIFGLDDYQKAIDKSQCKLHHLQAPIIQPLYSQFMTQGEWRKIFLNAGWIVLSVLILLGVIMNYRTEKYK